MQGGGTLAISVKNRSGAFVQVDFQDQGHGIDPAAVPRIFEPGFTTKAGSPGLGLSVCKKVIEQHGGSIQVQSSTQQGTTFSLLLPLEKGSA
jgi:signal transduction histidine kinase